MIRILPLSLLVAAAIAGCSPDDERSGDQPAHPIVSAGQEAGSTDCLAVNDTLRTPHDAQPAPGDYTFTIVATEGPKEGGTAQGILTLRRATPGDRSPRTGEGPASGERRAHLPLWGFTTADLRLVGADLPGPGLPDIPPPESEDPIYPGVVVLVQNWQSDTLLRQNTLWIASGANPRAEQSKRMVDGPGIVLRVRQMDSTGMSGTWGPAGLRIAGGYFCAKRLREP